MMSDNVSDLASPFSTGGGGIHFEEAVQAAFAALMLANGFAPCSVSLWPITKIKLQGKYDGFDTDDLIVYMTDTASKREKKLLAQMKHAIKFSTTDKTFRNVIQAAWSDYSNPRVFTYGVDAIALITGPLSRTDMEVRMLLEWARYTADEEDFVNKVSRFKFSSNVKRQKLDVFRKVLKDANRGMELDDKQLWEFLRSYHLLGYDLDIRSGVIHSLLHSVIGQFSTNNIQSIWASIVYEMSHVNQNAGVVTVESLSEELRQYFYRPSIREMPAALSQQRETTDVTNWNESSHAANLALAMILGSWSDDLTGDREVAEKVAKKGYDDWIEELRNVIQMPTSPLTFRNGQWRMRRRSEMWDVLGPRLFDEHLDRIGSVAKSVFESVNQRLQPTRGKVGKGAPLLHYSPILREGLADTLALVATKPIALTKVSEGKTTHFSTLIVRYLLDDAAWIRWASLGDVLSILAEAAPTEFISQLEKGLVQSLSPIAELFSGKDGKVFREERTAGIINALEVLAWEEAFLPRVTVLLGRLSELDPGGAPSQRASRSLTTIFVPWYPQTNASFVKQAAAIKALVKEAPQTAWNVVVSLLPNQHGVSFGTKKAKWRKYDGEPLHVTHEDYWKQVAVYADMAVDMVFADSNHVVDLIPSLVSLPPSSIDKYLKHLKSPMLTGLSSAQRAAVWTELTKVVRKHRRYRDSDWALDESIIDRIEAAVEPFAPTDLLLKFKPLFSERDFDLYEGEGDWKDRRETVESYRTAAVSEVFESGGIDLVVRLAEAGDRPNQVGAALATVTNSDDEILPLFLNSTDKVRLRLAAGYIWERQRSAGVSWVDGLDKTSWSDDQVGLFFTFLPFTSSTWDRVSSALKSRDGEYWTRASVHPFQIEGSAVHAIDKLLQHGRPADAVDCIHWSIEENQELDYGQALAALRASAPLLDGARSLDVFNAVEVIKTLQSTEGIDQDAMLEVEWLFIPVLDEFHYAKPKFLEIKLASDPSYFSQVIRTVFRSTKVQNDDSE